jgi:hypothetical protein
MHKMGQSRCLIQIKDFSEILSYLLKNIEEPRCVRGFGFFDAQDERTLSSSV